eukprot:gene15712-27472_t
MKDSFNQTRAYIELLDSNPPGIDSGLGDWMPVQNTKTSFTGPGFQHMSYLAFANITELLGMPALATKYRAKASAIVDAVNAKFFNASTGAYSASGSGKLDASQCGQGMALFMDFVPETHRAKALAVMADNARDTAYIAAPGGTTQKDPNGLVYNCTDCGGGPGAHMTAGLFSIKWFLMSLADGNMNDLAYETLTTPSYPGWFFSSNTFSQNHPMFASSEVWLLQSVGGIQPHPAAKGFDKVLIKPSPPSQLEHAEATYNTVRGLIKTKWTKTGGLGLAAVDDAATTSAAGGITLEMTIPPNVAATVHIPTVTGRVEEASSPGRNGIGRRKATGARQGKYRTAALQLSPE